MPSCNYHIKFELYPTPDPTSEIVSPDDIAAIWIPNEGSSIFDELPFHPRTNQLKPPKSQQLDIGLLQDKGKYSSTSSIECGTDRAYSVSPSDELTEPNTVRLTERQWRARRESVPAPGFSAGLGAEKASGDWRFGRISVESFDTELAHSMAKSARRQESDDEGGGQGPRPAPSLGPTFGGPGQSTKGEYVPLETKHTEAGWGMVHLYREGGDASGTEMDEGKVEGDSRGAAAQIGEVVDDDDDDDNDGLILCIPAVPTYLSPSDFLGFVGEKWRGDVCHYRMVMTSRMNRYMVLMKFKDKWRATEWRKEFDGKAFNGMEPELCHVTYIKSITFETPKDRQQSQSQGGSSAVVSSLKPFPPPTPNLIELPTCPVCLERMDDTTGLMTILCQHVFHCTCLQTWKGSGCPVCRATNHNLLGSSTDPSQEPLDPDNPYAQPFGQGISNLCSVCDCPDDLWICLICGNVGCGRYKEGHAKKHWQTTAHSFSLELETQHIWDYAGDMWVHRLIREKGEGKVVELPSRGRQPGSGANSAAQDEDVVPRAKLENIGLEYTNLLNTQLETQRIYFEEKLSKLADKAAKSAAIAESAAAEAKEATRQSVLMQAEIKKLKEEIVPGLEKDLARERQRANKSTDLARNLGKSLQEEKVVSKGLMERVAHVNKELESLKAKVAELKLEKAELEESNRDLTMFISGQEQLKKLEGEGQIEAGELEEGVVSLPEEKTKGKGKGRRKK